MASANIFPAEIPEESNLSRSFLGELRRQSQSDREIFASLQHELRRLARAKMRRERPDHTLQPTALVHEAFMKLFRSELPKDFWTDTTKALRLIAHVMEQILNDHADAHYAKKRGGKERRRVALNGEADQSTEERGAERLMDERLMVTPAESETVIGVREALGILRRVSPRQAEVLQLQFYGGLTQEEIAGILHVSLETVKLDTRKAKALLKVHLASRTK